MRGMSLEDQVSGQQKEVDKFNQSVKKKEYQK